VKGLNLLIGKSSAQALAMIAEVKIDKGAHQMRIRQSTDGATE
jgi:hypothetical protein